jgi:hypothetical protein
MVINDFDRHEDNWDWAKFEKDSITLYKAFPKDRDHALSRVDGLIMHFVCYALGHTSFRKYEPIE